MKKILVDDAYKKIFKPWVEDNILGLEVKFCLEVSNIKKTVRAAICPHKVEMASRTNIRNTKLLQEAFKRLRKTTEWHSTEFSED